MATNSESTSAPVPNEPSAPAEPADDGELQEMGLVTQVVSLNTHDSNGKNEEAALHSIDVFHNQVCLAEDDLRSSMIHSHVVPSNALRWRFRCQPMMLITVAR